MLLVERVVGKKRPVGRPAAFEGGSKQVKLPEDLMLMVSWLARIEGVTAAQIIDPLVRPSVTSRFALRYSQIVRIKEAEDEAAVASGRDPSPPLPRFTTEHPLTGEEVDADQAAKAQGVKKRRRK